MVRSLFSTAAILAVASAANNTTTSWGTSTSTEVVTAYTTVCPSPTSFTEGNRTYVVTEATTLTITDCPCTRTHTWTTEYVTVCPPTETASPAPAPTSAEPAKSSEPAPTQEAATSAPDISNNAGRAGLSLAAIAAAAFYLL